MTRRWIPGRTMHVGIALSADRLVAALPGDSPESPWTRPLTPTGDPAVTWPDLAAALGALRAAVGGTGSRRALHVALLPPLAQLRRVDLPGLRSAEARQVLRREPSRYLPLPADAPPIELEIEGEGWRRGSPFTMFAVPRALVEGIHAAANAVGWPVAEIVPAEAAWAAGASSLLPRANGDERVVVVCTDERVEVLRVQDDRIVAIRRVPSRAASVASLALAGSGDATRPAVAVIGDSPIAGELRAALAAPGVTPRAHGGDGALYFSPALLAARFAPQAAGPALLPEPERLTIEHRAARATKLRFAAAAALLTGAALLQLWGLSREHDAIVAQRARLREPVARALAVRDSLGQVSSRLATIRSASSSSPQWAPLLVALSARLPDDAFLLSLRADGDSLRLEGEAARAAGVFDALRGVQGFSALRPDGPIRQEIADDGSTSERFTLSARVVREP